MARTAEQRYRRLLLSYPADYRHERGDDLLAVSLDIAEAEGRDRPTMGERFDLVGHGLLRRVRGWRGAGRSSPVGFDALAAFTVVLPLILAARLSRGLGMGARWVLVWRDVDQPPVEVWLEPLIRTYVPSAIWLLVALVLCAGAVRVARVLSVVAVVVQVVVIVISGAVRSVDLLWLAGGLVAAALLLIPGLAARGVIAVGRGWLAALTVGAAAALAIAQVASPGARLGNGLLVWLAAVVAAGAVGTAVGRRRGRAALAVGALVGLYLLVAGIGLQWVNLYSAGAPVEITVWGLTSLGAALAPTVVVAHRDRLRRAWEAFASSAE